MFSIRKAFRDIANWIKGVADYPISIEQLSDTTLWKNRTLTKYKSGRMVFEGVRTSVNMKYVANGNAYIDYITLDIAECGFVDVKQAIVKMGYNDTPKGEHLLYCTDDEKGNLIAWVGALSAGSHTITNVRFKVDQRWKILGGGVTNRFKIRRWSYA